MLSEYFGLEITPEGGLASLPVLLEQYTPDMDRLPSFLLSLATDVQWDWSDERACFHTLALALADFYAVREPLGAVSREEGRGGGRQAPAEGRDLGARLDPDLRRDDPRFPASLVEAARTGSLVAPSTGQGEGRAWALEHVIFPSLRLFLKPPRGRADRADGSVLQITTLEKLYRTFERC